MTERKYRVVVCEDEPRLLANLEKKIEKLFPHFKIVGTAEDGLAAVKLLAEESADVLVTDIKMPGVSGLELIKLAVDRYPQMKTIVVSGFAEFSYAQQAITYGVVDYLLKPVTNSRLEKTFALVQAQLERSESVTNARSSQISPGERYSSKAIAPMVQDYIRTNYMRDINVQEISERFHLNPSYLSRVFQKHLGESPARYITMIRIEAAKALLLNRPDLLIRDVGELVGYLDPFHFSRVFKATIGVSPESFRDGHKEGPPVIP